jgi:aminomethyltransferase
MPDQPLNRTPLFDAHQALGAKFVPFAGYEMPVQYRDGVMAEHRWTRAHAGLFDVSHMGPAFLALDAPSGDPEADHAAVSALIETLVPGDIAGLKRGQQRYTLLLNSQGGVIDDMMIARPWADDRQGWLLMVVNAGTKSGDFALIAQALAGRATLRPLTDHALIALQGPEAAAVLEPLAPATAGMTFMQTLSAAWRGHELIVSRSGYTGEDGFEILLDAAIAPSFWDALLADERVRAIGLGARDSLRLEAGLPLYGHDLDETVSPVEAGLAFALSKRRRLAGDFPGAARVRAELDGAPARIRVGLMVHGAPAREGAPIADTAGTVVGRVTSGGFSPSLSAPIALGFVPTALAQPGTALTVIVRGKAQAAQVVALPFVPHRYARKA